jgi:cytochrome c553/cytochrome c5
MKSVLQAFAVFVVLLLGRLLRTSRSHEEPARSSIARWVVTHPWLTAAALTFAVVMGATLVVVSGVMPIKASSGHWRITAALLDFAKRRSVATHSVAIQPPPDLDDEALVLLGASHYEYGCNPCHGRPGAGVPPIMAAMTPVPPALMDRLSRYRAEELFSIVKHGIKFTGMPAWPVQQRDDEVWAVVSFLRRMPKLDAAAYRQLAYGEGGDAASNLPMIEGTPPPQAVQDVCSRCHGVDGTGRGPGAFPSLAGQRPEYLYASLRAFADRSRHSGIMGGIVADLSDEVMRAVAEYYAALPPRGAERPVDPSAFARGAAIATRGVPDRDIPACAECHGPTDVLKNPMYPKLATQPARYLTSQIELLKQRRRGGTPNVELMHAFVDRLSPEHVRDVTLYFGSLNAP